MSNREIRLGQLIAPFGPGSIYTDRRGTPLVICGLDHWYKSENKETGKYDFCADRKEFERLEPRLSTLLRVNRFCIPPDFRQVWQGDSAPPNAFLHVPAHRFPRWYRQTKTGELQEFNLTTVNPEKPSGGGRWRPVRFISVCAGGHLNEFPWQAWAGCTCGDSHQLLLKDFGGSELTSIKVECSKCGKSANLGRTTKIPVDASETSAFGRAGISCPGGRPWLGDYASEERCPHPLVGALINQTNLYFPKIVSAITLPDLGIKGLAFAPLRALLEANAPILNLNLDLTAWRMGGEERSDVPGNVCRKLRKRLNVDAREEDVAAALSSLFDNSGHGLPGDTPTPSEQESELLAFRRAEFNILREPIDNPVEVPNLRVIATKPSPDVSQVVSKVHLVERLLETRVFYGFSRLKPEAQPLAGVPDSAMAQLFRDPPKLPQDRWLPAIEVFGEGIYVELDEERILSWQKENQDWLRERITLLFLNRLQDVRATLPPLRGANIDWATRYLLLHSFTHILINQLVFECGYSSASLRERLYISSDPSAPMAGLLIYTAAGDAEGTLGGLVRLGRPENFGAVLARALSRASWCSADPICSEHLGGSGSRLANLAACHACALLPETCCETINEGLD